MAKIITSHEFESEVLNSDTPVVVDFFADWCMPCKMLAPSIDAASNEFDGQAKIFKLDIDQASDIAKRYNVKSVPTLMFFKGGEVVDQVLGAVPKAVISDRINKML